MKTGIPVAEAQRIVLEAVAPLPAETVPAQQAQGRVLAESVNSPRTLPPADCSAMDGYAVRAADLAGASAEAPVELPVVYEVAAGGHGSRPLAPGETARIFTGAPVPPGADAVVRQEDTEASDDRCRFRVAPPVGQNVREAGEDVRSGEVVLRPGDRLAAAELGMLASLGRSLVRVHQRPRVAILSGGDELVDPDGDPSGGRIVASNAYSLAAMSREAGAEPVNLGIARDTPEDHERLLRGGLGADLIVSSAGVSVGDHDHVRPVLEKLGCRLVFWGVRLKPGFPMTFGRFEGHGGPLVFALPGNPVSAMVCFEQFVRPVLRKLVGHRRWFRPTLEVVVAEGLRKKAGRLHLVRVALTRDGDRILARSVGNQSSGALHSMTLADGLLIFPAEAEELREGETARVQVLDLEFFSESASGC